MRIDAHHHVWRLDRGDYNWLTPDMAIHRDYGLDDYRELLGDIEASILVQAAATDAETAFMLATARGSRGLVRGVVGWTDLAATDVAETITALRDDLLKGLRPMLQDIADTDWILRTDVSRGLAAMADAGLRLDLLVTPRHLPILPELARRHRDLAVVIDHGAKPDIAAGAFQPWANDIARIAWETPWCCKLSGLATEAGRDWQAADLRRYVDHLLDCFGPSRLMWGSDWPVVELAGGFAKWREAAIALVPAECHAAVLGGTAARFYGLG